MNINKSIQRLAIPNIISNITVPLVGLVDVWLMGHLDDGIYIGAISLGSVFFLFIYSGFGFLRMGTTGFTAQAYGSKKMSETILILGRASFIVLISATGLLIFQDSINNIGFSLINGTEEVESLASEYFKIRIWAAPATLAIYALSGWFIGMQNAIIPTILAIVVNIANIGFSSYFILIDGMKSDGVALGTVLAQYTGLILGIILLSVFYRKMFKYWKIKLILKLKGISDFMKVNKDILIRSLLLTGTFFFFNSESAAFGDDLLSINSLMLQFLWILSYFVDGIAYAAEALVGKAIGAVNKKLLKATIKSIFKWSFYTVVPITLLYVLFYKNILGVLTDKEHLVQLIEEYAFWIWLMPVVTFAAFIWDGIYVGATSSVTMRNSMIFASLIIFLPVYYLCKPSLENHALWLALMLFMAARGLSMTVMAKRSVYNKIV